jgi:uncharacterized membrane protein YkvA (DUF1232 family)
MGKISKEQEKEAKEQFEETIKEINQNDVIEASKDGLKKIKELEGKIPKVLKEIWDDIKMMIYMITDYVKGNYQNVNWKTIAAITGAIIYFLSPIDLIPDFIPIVGYLDDLTVIKIALNMIKEDFDKYKNWKINN